MPLSCSDFAFVGVASKLEKPYVDAMISCAREFMKRRQTPQTFHKTMWLWWCVNFYFPRKIKSLNSGFTEQNAPVDSGAEYFGLRRYLEPAAQRRQKLKVGGTYVTEDIKTRDLPQWLEHLPTLDRDHPGYEFALVELPNEFNDSDNNLLLVRRVS